MTAVPLPPIVPLADLVAELRGAHGPVHPIVALAAADRLEEMANGGAHSIANLVGALMGDREARAIVRGYEGGTWLRTSEGVSAADELTRLANLLGVPS